MAISYSDHCIYIIHCNFFLVSLNKVVVLKNDNLFILISSQSEFWLNLTQKVYYQTMFPCFNDRYLIYIIHDYMSRFIMYMIFI